MTEPTWNIGHTLSFFDELKRRNVIRFAGLYVAGAWLVLQVAGTVLPMMGASAWLSRGIVVVLAIGFIPALVFAWVFELTPEGLKRESDIDRSQSITPKTGRTLDRVIIVVLALALGYFAFDKFVLAPQRTAEQTDAARQAGRSEALVASYGDKSIAVLPFVDMSPGKDHEYFSDGIAEELLNLLARVPQLRVISRSSAFSYKGKDVKLAQVAEELNVAHILEGSVRKAGDQVRITAQLIEARSDTHLWSHTWDRELDDVFAVQDEIAAAVVEQLKVTLLGGAPKAQEVDPQAYALYLQARHLGRLNSAEGFAQAIAVYEQALVISPDYAAAWEGLARSYSIQAGSGQRPFDEGYRLARAAAEKSLAIDPDYAPAHARLGAIAMDHRHDLAQAARHTEQALQLAPSDTDILGRAAALLAGLGRLDEAIALREYVSARDPVNPVGHANLGWHYLYAGRWDEAIAAFGTALRLSPDLIGAHYGSGVALLLKGEPEAARAAMQEEPDEGYRLMGLALTWQAQGEAAAAETALAELIAGYEQDSAFDIAYVLAYRNESDRAFEWLDKALEHGDPGLSSIGIEPLFLRVHTDPRWLPMLRKLGKAPEQLAAIKFDVKLPQ